METRESTSIRVLRYLGASPATPETIGGHLGVSRATVFRVLKDLRQEGFVRRSNPKSRINIAWEITREGRAFYNEMELSDLSQETVGYQPGDLQKVF